MQPRCVLRKASGDLDLRSYTSVWHRRPGLFQSEKFVEPWISRMVEKEASAAVEGMFRSLPCIWMNFPADDAAATTKLWQLQLALDVGLTIPETCVTNNPDDVREFYESCNGEVIYKLINDQSPFSIPANEAPAGITTLPLREEDLPHLDQVAHAPHLFQRRVKKAFEVRVTIVGREVFSVSIDSQSGQGKIDWRNDYSVEMKSIEIPKDIREKCLALMRRLNLNYGALDFIVTDENQYVFLENNPQGQYYWAEVRSGLKISQQIALLLTGQAEPLIAPV